VPTKRPRHAITETPPVQAALDELRDELGSERVQLGELVILGAQAKLAQLQSEREDRSEAWRRLAERVRAADVPVDRRAADQVRRTGWSRL